LPTASLLTATYKENIYFVKTKKNDNFI